MWHWDYFKWSYLYTHFEIILVSVVYAWTMVILRIGNSK